MLPFLVVIVRFFRSFVNEWRNPELHHLSSWVVILLVSGITFYHSVEGWGWLDSAYFCVIVLTTVGLGDFAPQTSIGKLFTIFYVLTGIGTILAFVNSAIASKRT
jgi:voltage-gated potassium channel